MTDGEMNKLKQKQKEIIEEITEFQSKCKHENEEIRMVQDVSMTSLRIVCKDCETLLRYPSQEEQNKYLSNEK